MYAIYYIYLGDNCFSGSFVKLPRWLRNAQTNDAVLPALYEEAHQAATNSKP